MADIEVRNHHEIKNDALRFIRSYHRNSINRKELKTKLENLQKVVGFCSLTNQEMFILMSTFLKNIDRFKELTFQSFLLCCVPEKKLEKNFTCALMEWLLDNYDHENCETKCLILMKWFCSLLKNNLLEPSDLDQHFIFLFKLAGFPAYLTAMCPLLFYLSSHENTLGWMLDLVQHLLTQTSQNRFLVMLSRKLALNESHSQMSGDALVWPYPSGLPPMNKILNMRLSARIARGVNDLAVNDILKPEAPLTPSPALLPLAQIKTPHSFAHFFHIICLPDDIVSLLSTNLGVLKTILDANMEDEFVTRLKFKLTDMFLSKERVYKESECRSMLQYVFTFQKLIQQGIDCVSNFLAQYLRVWNGLDYREEILGLCEWFVFSSKMSLVRDLLVPLHGILLTSDPEDKKLFLDMYGKLYTNLLMEADKLVNKNERRLFLSVEACGSLKCDWMRSEEASRDVFSSLSTAVVTECTMAILYTPSHRDMLLYTTLDLCLKCLTAEDCFNKSLLTMVPRCAVYLPLFSPSLRNISSVCFMLDKYKQYQRSERLYGLYIREFNVIDGYIEDYINYLWRGTGWDDRNEGEAFPNNLLADSIDSLRGRYSAKQLNSSLHIRNHVAIITLASHIMDSLGLGHSDLSDERFLDTILQSLCPTLVSFIKTYREEDDVIY